MKYSEKFTLLKNLQKKVWKGGGEILSSLFSKKIPFFVNIGRYSNIL